MKNLKKSNIIFIGILAILLLFGYTLLSNRTTIISLEERINTQYIANKSSYDNMWKKFKEMTQVTDIQAKNMKDVYKDIIIGRYNDPKLLSKMVLENNPQLDQKVFTNLQSEIAASRNAFNNNQKQINDVIREYNTYVKQKFITAAIFGFKTKDPKDFTVTSERTEKAFDTKLDDEIKLK
ncbi:hypothetical protein BD780_003102 [Clostridium tetanomorphum]|uniref:LemA family protein n=1 Tax=Clostridium tetanomorphum TaxID=1553 RepID=A0A923EC39_CLOTT|nr:hypothetical protein [Clostridium tetanomorphum]KAJ50475.1 hypothetical protein CTM_17706 [Clostridium tetanomorphum DSM 665]MBC2398264.1 LemA family protein [Clostridium tetanomorphum]MBP1865617.1 hypothetical protein [Clostridium tetanomorphum]NRS85877.1 hypothetical protein [Clostridium tetanomorphum]NRZ96115.1 hypothetical protein [Clostridium tetanomorphum]